MRFVLATPAILGAFVLASGGALAAPSWTLLEDFGIEATALVVQPDDNQTLWASFRTTVDDSAGVWMSADGGDTWSLSLDTDGKTINAIAIDPDNPTYLWAAWDAAKVSASTDGGTSWNELTGFGFGAKVLDLAIPKGNNPTVGPYRVYFATSNGLFFTDTGGQTPFDQFLDFVPLQEVEVCPDDYNTVWAGTDGAGGLYISSDGFATWTLLDGSVFQARDRAQDLAMNPVNCAEALYSTWAPNMSALNNITTDGGTTWTEIEGGTGDGLMITNDGSETYYGIGGGEDGVFYSSTGVAFDVFSEGLADGVSSLAAYPDDGLSLYAASETGIYSMTVDFHPGTPTGIVAACTDSFEVTVSWDSVTMNADGGPITDLDGYVLWAVFPPFGEDRDTVAVLDASATNYVDFGSMYPVLQYTVSAFDSAGISGAVGEASDQIVPSQCPTGIEGGAPGPLAGRSALGQNSPNPFNPRTTLEYTVSEADAGRTLTLAIYGARGELIRKLVDRQAASGTHRVVWNGKDEAGTGVSSGVYFSLLTVGETHEVRSMLLVK